jgi:drug/metabolite transporter (DMT)-like permease
MRSSNGFLIAAAGFAVLTCGDAILKSIVGTWPAPAVASLRFALAVPLLLILLTIKDGKTGFAITKPWIQIARGLAMACTSLCFIISLFLMPLAEATAIVFASPVITAVLSALFLKVPMHPRLWVASVLALIGVALVLRPNLGELGWIALLPVVAAFFFSIMMIFNRLAAGTGSPLALQLVLASVAAPVVIAGAFVLHFSGEPSFVIPRPDNSVILRCAIVAFSASAAHWLIFQGTMRATAADAAQAVYIQLPVALTIDALVFRHFPDIMALTGAALIIAAGLSMWLHQRQANGA